MPSVKIPKKSTATDMTPFVDVAFLILAFFMLATKFKPPEPAPIVTPTSVSSDQLKEENRVLVQFDSAGRVFFSMDVKISDNNFLKRNLIENVNKERSLGLTDQEMSNFAKNTVVGVPFNELKSLLAAPTENRVPLLQKAKGIPVDSTNNELATWITLAKATFYKNDPRMQVFYMIKGHNDANYPSFDGVIEAMRRSDQYNYKLVTDPKETPTNTELYRIREAEKNK